MPVDPNIARGFQAPDVSNTLLNIAQLRQRDQALADDRNYQNALIQQHQQTQQDAATEAQHQQQARAILAAGRAGNPQARAYALKMLAEKAPPEIGQSMAQADPEQAWPHIEAALAQYLGEKPQVAPSLPSSVQEYQYAQQNPGYQRWVDRNRQATTGGNAGGYRILSPEETKGAGLPEGTVAQVSPEGKVDILSKGVQQQLTPKDASAAQVKLRQIQLAKRQLELVRQKFGALKGTFSSGLGGNYIPSEAGKQADAAVNSMRDTLTSITRVPGIGAMSDYETRLQQAKFPDRGQYESVSDQQIQSVQDTLDLLEKGYTDMLQGGPAQAPSQPDQPQRTQAPQQAIDYLKAHPETKAAFFKKYGYLP